ncbi:YdgA family protein [Pseudomonas fontis]|uniref:YdgA family protein n=1 Tax=Pseudomonas fontis TaxID=2942633 RepID=A0ABT5NWW9_9PSED|nr:YdgA family protein [Pseudomonas fontis]MDD0975751.1 YdgA family protein [Pseudomonas fontis]MDD0992614.1 YdgA family protein [Pseudomonas fontis]
MKKTVGALSGLALAVAAICTAGAWYTGQQLPAVLDQSIAQSNQQLAQSIAGAGGSAQIELLSLERHLYSSTARYHLKVENLQLGEERVSFELTFVDRIEHGPLPWSRLKAFKLMPVMASSNYALEKDAGTAGWFAASNDVAPLQGHMSLGYDRSVDGQLRLMPLDITQAEGSSVKLSGVTLDISGGAKGETVKLAGDLGSLAMTLVTPDRPPVKIALQGLELAANLKLTPFGFYVGQVDLLLADSAFTYGDRQAELAFKGMEQRNDYQIEGSQLAVKQVYKVADISYDGKPVGSAQVAWSARRLDVPAVQALMEFYANNLPAFEQATAAGVSPSQALTEAQRADFQQRILAVLAGKPQLALDDVSFKTANGESRFKLTVDLAQPASLDLPLEQVSRQMIEQVQSDLSLSKPMIGDLAALQAKVQGEDVQQIEQASRAGEMVAQMAMYTQLATIKDDAIVSNLHYANGQVNLNGKNMTVEQFAALLMSNFGALQGPR